MTVCYEWLTNLPVMTLHGRMLYFTSPVTIRQLSEVLVWWWKQEEDKGIKKVVRSEDMKEIIPHWISASHFH